MLTIETKSRLQWLNLDALDRCTLFYFKLLRLHFNKQIQYLILKFPFSIIEEVQLNDINFNF